MKKADFYFGIALVPMVMIAIGAFALDSDIYDNCVTLIVAWTLLWLVYRMMVKPLFNWIFKPVSRTYTIRKGKNYSGYRFKPFYKVKPFRISVTLHSHCRIATNGIQKIFGLGDLDHHENSFRYGWKFLPDLNVFEIYEYTYFNGDLDWKPTGFLANPNERFFLEFDHYTVSKYKWGKFLFPYFEQDGDAEEGAPRKLKISIYFPK